MVTPLSFRCVKIKGNGIRIPILIIHAGKIQVQCPYGVQVNQAALAYLEILRSTLILSHIYRMSLRNGIKGRGRPVGGMEPVTTAIFINLNVCHGNYAGSKHTAE